jgi:hypothetical protein
VAVHNVSTRRLTVVLAPSSSLLSVSPARLVLEPGQKLRVKVTARASARPALALVTGVLAVRPVGGQPLRIPWAIAFRPPTGRLIRQVRLDPPAFSPSDAKPAVLQVVTGRIAGSRTIEIEPTGRLDVLLYRSNGAYLGSLAQVRDLLPGDYSFGITGRRPGGALLEPGSYEIRLVAWPVRGGSPTRARIAFRIE